MLNQAHQYVFVRRQSNHKQAEATLPPIDPLDQSRAQSINNPLNIERASAFLQQPLEISAKTPTPTIKDGLSLLKVFFDQDLHSYHYSFSSLAPLLGISGSGFIELRKALNQAFDIGLLKKFDCPEFFSVVEDPRIFDLIWGDPKQSTLSPNARSEKELSSEQKKQIADFLSDVLRTTGLREGLRIEEIVKFLSSGHSLTEAFNNQAFFANQNPTMDRYIRYAFEYVASEAQKLGLLTTTFLPPSVKFPQGAERFDGTSLLSKSLS